MPPPAPIEPVLVDGGWENANDGILGADNKAAVAVMLELARRADRRARAAAGRARAAVHRLRGGRRCAAPRRSTSARLRSAFGYVFDHATPIGEIVVASPTYYRIVAEFRGRAAHAGVRPEDGRSAIVAAARAIAAMRLGRLDAETTANIGTIAGGTAINVVPERCRLEAEVRSLDARPGPTRSRPRSSTTSRTPPTPPSATSTSPSSGCSTATGPSRRAPQVALAERALRALRLRAAADRHRRRRRTPTRFEAAGFAVH